MYGYKNIKKKGKCRGEHRIVMERHIGRTLETHEHVHHKNGDRKDNRLENLEIMLRPEHARHHMTGRRLGRSTKIKISEKIAGEGNGNHILTSEKVLQIKQMLLSGIKGTVIASQFGVGKKCINDIKLGKRWKHIKLCHQML